MARRVRPSGGEASTGTPASLDALADAEQACTRCDLYKTATQAVPGQGPSTPRVMLVGEQPGDQEDRAGAPFVGPAGDVLARAMTAAGLDRRQVFVTNAVKHFKWEPRGTRRIHQTPRWSEVRACKPWLDAEIALVAPAVLVCLGATAAKALLGASFRLTQSRGTVVTRARRAAGGRHLPSVGRAAGHRRRPRAPVRVPGRRSDARRQPRQARPVTLTGGALAPAVRMAALRYTSDAAPGITRLRRGRGFVYRWPDRRPLRDPATLARIRRLAIPPAWTQVWISPQADGHVQATGRDQRGRKQHRYHPRWTAVRDQAKYGRLLAFGRALPALRRQVRRDLGRPGLPHRKVVALVVQLLEKTLIRVGNDEYATQNRSFGLTTIRDGHARVAGPRVRFVFRGKSGKPHDVAIEDRRVARLVKQCQELPGSQLFQYRGDDGRVGDISSTDVNRYLRATMGQAFSAKDFRTWSGTVLAARALHEMAALPGQPAGDPRYCGRSRPWRERSATRAPSAGAATSTRQ